MKECRRFPTLQELHAIEQAARRARAEELRRLFAVGARKLRALIARGVMAFASKVRAARTHRCATVRNVGSTTRQTMSTSFWKEAAASLPPEVRRRYTANFEAAERFEYLVDVGIEAWGFARRTLAKSCQVAAHTLRTAARILDTAARRLTLAR